MGLFEKRDPKKQHAKISSEQRRANSNERIKQMGIKCFEELPMIEDSDHASLRSLDHICHRAVACLLSTQLACDIGNNRYEEAMKIFPGMLDDYGVSNDLNAVEKRLVEGTYTEQDAINVAWTYEAYWSLVWALGLVDDISDASEICDCQKAIRLVMDCASMDEFKQQCFLRNIEEILDMLDLFYRYDWAVTEKRAIDPHTPIGNLDPSVVVERRRGLEWLISEEDDWFDISLDT